jgi:hypothetical protein
MRSSILTAAIAVALTTTGFSAVANAQDATAQQSAPPATTTQVHHHSHHRTTRHVVAQQAPGTNVAAELAARDQEIAELKSAMSTLESKVASLEERTDAQSDINVSTQKNVETLQADAPKIDKLNKLVNDTTVGGRVFVDISDISQKKNGVKTANSGDGLDVKRGYFTVSHAFNDIWSASLTTDFNFVSADSETQLFIKKLYVQGKFSDAFVFRAGSADTPWIPYDESFYGYRYVDKTLVDRLGFGSSADWGLNASGKVADGRLDYSASVLNGGGFKNPTRTKSMDVEGRIGFAPIQNTVIAIGGYSGELGQETETTTSLHTATRGDALIAYAKDNNRLGVEYFEATDWKNVLTPLEDKANGYSVWASFGFTPTLSVFGRYDRAKPSKDLDPSLKDRFFNFGLQWDVRKGIKVSAVYKNEDLKDNVNDTKTDEFGIFGDVSF